MFLIQIIQLFGSRPTQKILSEEEVKSKRELRQAHWIVSQSSIHPWSIFTKLVLFYFVLEMSTLSSLPSCQFSIDAQFGHLCSLRTCQCLLIRSCVFLHVDIFLQVDVDKLQISSCSMLTGCSFLPVSRF